MAACSPDRIRQAILTNPRAAVRYLEQVEQQATSVVLRTLRAEAYLRVRRAERAFAASLAAVEMATPGTELLRAAAAVMTDIACWIGQPGAVDTCEDYENIAAGLGNRDARLCAMGLHAVVVYHWSECQLGREKLTVVAGISREVGAPAVLVMVENALAAMIRGCEPGGYPLDLEGWAPVPGGQLCPASEAWPSYLTSRLHRRAGTHTCETQQNAPASAPGPERDRP